MSDLLKRYTNELVKLAGDLSDEASASDGLELILLAAYRQLQYRAGADPHAPMSPSHSYQINDDVLNDLHSMMRIAYYHTAFAELGAAITAQENAEKGARSQ